MDRRTFNAGVAASLAASLAPGAQAKAARRTMLYTSVGDRITRYEVDADAATLTARESLALPSVVQYAWPHPSGRYLYASTSDATGGSRTPTGSVHRLCALRLDGQGVLALNGAPAVLAQRPIHNTVDARGAFALTAYNTIADIGVHPINPDGTLGPAVVQAAKLDTGIFPHQVRVLPHNRSVVLVTRGNSGGRERPEDPGALKLYGFDRTGQLAPLQTIAVGGRGGLGYGPRHLDFHPTRPFAYVSIERQNQLQVHRLEGEGFAPEPLSIQSSLAPDAKTGVHQVAGPIHVHPAGHTVYLSNRASGTVDWNGRKVFVGGENSIAVFRIDPATGIPTLIQRVDPQGFHVRAFAIHPDGKLLVAAHLMDMWVRDGDAARHVPAGLSLFRIAADGRLTFVRKYDVAVSEAAQQAWVGMITLPA